MDKKISSYISLNKTFDLWAELDLNQRSETQRIYNPPPLTTRAPTLYYRYMLTNY